MCQRQRRTGRWQVRILPFLFLVSLSWLVFHFLSLDVHVGYLLSFALAGSWPRVFRGLAGSWPRVFPAC